MNLKQWPIIIIVLVGISQMIYADVYRQNPYTGKPDNIGTFSTLSAQYRQKFTNISTQAASGGIAFESLSGFHRKSAHTLYSSHTQSQLNNRITTGRFTTYSSNIQLQLNGKVGNARFANNSTYTASHIRSVSPYGNHPAAGSNRQIQYNNAGTPAGAAQLNYSGSRVGIGTSNPQFDMHVASSGTSSSRGIFSSQHTTDTRAAQIAFGKSRGAESAPSIVASGDFIGAFETKAFDGYQYINPAFFGFVTEGTIVAGSATPTSDQTSGTYVGRVPTAIAFTTGSKQGSLANSGRGERLRISSTGLTYFSNSGGLPYGQMYSNTSTTITVSASGTWYEVDTGATDFTAGRLKNVTHTDHYLTAPTAGDYQINAAASFGTTTAGDEIALSVMVNGTASATCHGHATVVTATTTVPSSCVTILTLAANDQVSLAVQNHSAARNITLSHSQLSILHVGAP